MQETKENIRKQLYGFYIAYDLWLSNGAKPGGVFSRNYGLCANLFDYLTSIGTSSEAALEQLHADFRSAGLYEVLPFNESKGHYYEEKGNNMCHMNPARVAWVRTQIALVSLEAEPIAVSDDMAYAFHHALSDSSPGADEVEEIKAGLRAAFTNVTTQPAPVVPEFETWFNSQESGRSICSTQIRRSLQEISWNACCAAMLQGKGDGILTNEDTKGDVQVRELTMLIKQLVSQLRKAKPDCKLPEKAMVYLKRNGLISAEDILR